MSELYTRIPMVGVAVAGALAGSTYLLYKWWKAGLDKEVDEGFSEKGGPEPLRKRILVLGLDSAGKSHLLSTLSHKPDGSLYDDATTGFNVISLQRDQCDDLDIWEIGGGSGVRKYWPNFVQDTDILVFMVDSTDRERFSIAYDEMHKLLGEPRLVNTPFVVLANKQDLANAASTMEIKEALGLEDIKLHRVEIIGTSLTAPSPVGIAQLQDLLFKLK